MNNNNQNQDLNNRNSSNRSKQIVFILAVYILLVLSSKFGSKTDSNAQHKLVTILKSNQTPTLSQLFSIFQIEQQYIGRWQKVQTLQQTAQQFNNLFNFQNSGKSKLQFTNIADKQITFDIILQNGDYIDEGDLYSTYNLQNFDTNSYMNFYRSQNVALVVMQNNQNITLPGTSYKVQKIFSTIQVGFITIQKIEFNFSIIQQKVNFQGFIKTPKFTFKYNALKKQSFMAKTIFFAFVVLIISYFSFNSVLNILRKIIEGSQSAQKYSLISVLMATLWDSVICLMCFIEAFTNEQNLILFILPSFMLCILFTNLELRWMLAIFQSNNNSLDLRSIICRFNIISYGSFLLIYPLLLLTNLNAYLFITISLIFLPQIYVNAQKGIRPDLAHPYYSKFLMFRFLIIFYVRGFPFNIFQLKPNYVLCLICLILIGIQYFILRIQQIYGPKTVLPRFLLPPVFNYKLQQEPNIQQGAQVPQCAICLTPLHIDPDFNQPEIKNQYNNIPRMKTPCNHKYHSKCLIEWMNIKKECPQCRTALPPFQ